MTGSTSTVFNTDTLILESSVEGLPVTEVSSGALAMSKDENGNFNYSLRNVIVPASITKVYGRAFLDNKRMENIVFLADYVEFNNTMDYYNNMGAAADSDTERNYPFYGVGNNSSGNIVVNEYLLQQHFQSCRKYILLQCKQDILDNVP